jgi:hypothetical protein
VATETEQDFPTHPFSDEREQKNSAVHKRTLGRPRFAYAGYWHGCGRPCSAGMNLAPLLHSSVLLVIPNEHGRNPVGSLISAFGNLTLDHRHQDIIVVVAVVKHLDGAPTS